MAMSDIDLRRRNRNLFDDYDPLVGHFQPPDASVFLPRTPEDEAEVRRIQDNIRKISSQQGAPADIIQQDASSSNQTSETTGTVVQTPLRTSTARGGALRSSSINLSFEGGGRGMLRSSMTLSSSFNRPPQKLTRLR